MRVCLFVSLLLVPFTATADMGKAVAAYNADNLEDAALHARAALETALSPEQRLHAREILALSEYHTGRLDFALRDELQALDAALADAYGDDALERISVLYALSGVQYDLGLTEDSIQTDILLVRISKGHSGTVEDFIWTLRNLAITFENAGKTKATLLYSALFEFWAIDLLGPTAPISLEATAMTSRALLADGQAPRAFQRFFTQNREIWDAFAASGDEENHLMTLWFQELDAVEIDDQEQYFAAIQAEMDRIAQQDAIHDEIALLLEAGQFNVNAPEYVAALDRMRDYLDIANIDDPMVAAYASMVLRAEIGRGDFVRGRPYLMAALSYPPEYAAVLEISLTTIAATLALKGGSEDDLLAALIAKSFEINAILPVDHPEMLFDLKRALGQLHDRAGDKEGALKAYEDALAFAARTEGSEFSAFRSTLSDAGAVAAELGRHEVAQALHRQLLKASRLANDEADILSALGSLSLTAIAMGEPQKAQEHARQMLALAEASVPKNSRGITAARVRLALGMIAASEEVTPELIDLLATIASEPPPPGGLSPVDTDFLILVATRLEVAPARFRDDPVFSRLAPDAMAQIVSLLGELAVDAGDYATAGDWAALGLSLAVPASEEFFRLKEIEGRVALADARPVDALLAFRTISDVRVQPEARQRQGALDHLPYHISAAMALAADPAAGADLRFENEAFLMAQLASATSAGGALNAAMARRQAGGDVARLLRERAGIAREIGTLEAAIARARYSGLSADEILGRAGALRARHQALSAKIAEEAPDLASMAAFNPLSLLEVAGRLRDDEALLLYITSDVSGPDGKPASFVLGVSSENVMVAEMPSRSDVGALASALRCSAALTDPNCAGAAEGTRGTFQMPGAAPAAGPQFDTGLAHRAYDRLIAPVAALIAEKERLIIVPDQTLVSLPFHLLLAAPHPAGQPLRKADWLIRAHSIEIAPTVAGFVALRDRGSRREGASRFLGIGDPLIGAQRDGPLPVDCGTSAPGPLVLASAVPDALQRSAGAERLQMIAELTALPDARCELEEIADRFTDATLLIQDAASETAVKALSESGALRDYAVVSFATHGLVAGEIGVNDSGLVLTPPSVPTARDDGLLTTAEIAELDLDADFVILSACNTASGDSLGDEGLSGMASAFFLAGARSILASHWPVYSDAAVELTTKSFALLDEVPGLSRADAIRRAMLTILDDPSASPRRQHPSYWGPFMVVGDGLGR
ncbi:MAG: CHAT domain-containing tetratricopeptide repeat protein [Pseudomonadota bacterium]